MDRYARQETMLFTLLELSWNYCIYLFLFSMLLPQFLIATSTGALLSPLKLLCPHSRFGHGDSYSWKLKDGANDNCCLCKNAIPTPKPISSCSGDTPNWKDPDNFSCAWYDVDDAPGCPWYGDYEGSDGVANINCCWCFGTGSPTTTMPTSAFPTIALVWEDSWTN